MFVLYWAQKLFFENGLGGSVTKARRPQISPAAVAGFFSCPAFKNQTRPSPLPPAIFPAASPSPAGSRRNLLSTMPRKPKRKAPASPARHEPSPEPYPSHASPSSAQCLAVRDALLAFHGFPEEFAPFRLLRLGSRSANRDPQPQPSSPTVLDGLVITLLSQNTTDAISRRAFASLKAAFPSWDQVSY